jgi:peptidoglycan-associated lipoprotein
MLEPSARFSDWEKAPEIETIYFDFDRSDLGEETRNTLKKNAQFMKNNTDLTYIVEGNCDERGTVAYNLALGQRRALAVREYYGKLGVPLSSMATISYGSEKPEVTGSSEEAWAKNRRAETKARSNK